jgi:hypothetical protein
MHKSAMLALSLFAVSVAALCADVPTASTNASDQTPPFKPSPYFFTTKAYQREALRTFLPEINRVVRDLNLSEPLPITESHLVDVFISPPASGMIGRVTTSNYSYTAGPEKKFAGVHQLPDVWDKQSRTNRWPISRMNTNAALATATQIMAAAGMDAEGLNRDCRIDIRASMPDGPRAKYFLPDYWVTWRKPGKVVAFLVFTDPNKIIRTLSVSDSAYILRKPIVVSNAAELLRQGNPPPGFLRAIGLESTNTPPSSTTSNVSK